MKYKLSKYIRIIAILTLLQGCSDFLEIDNPSAVTDSFYYTKTGQEKLLVDIYSKFRTVFNTGQLQYYGTDLYMAITESPDERMFNGYDPSFNSTAGVVGPYWKNLYRIVQEANILLTRISIDEEGMTQDDFNSITAQTKFLRVLAYYYLVETFGPVPLLVTEESSIITEVERTNEEEIYSFLIDELISVKGILPGVSSEPGRITNAALLHLLGKLYLTRAYKPFNQNNDFENAAKIFDELILDPQHNHYLLDDFKDVFDENNQNNAEIIWAIQYGEDKEYSGSGNPQQSLFGINIVALEPELFDKVQDDYSLMQRGYWVNPKVHELFNDPEIDSRYDKTFQREYYVNNKSSEHFGELGVYYSRWNDGTDYSGEALHFYPFKKDGEYVWYPQSTALDVLSTASDRMPMLNKFKDAKMQWGGPGTREDVIFRMADTYLLCAEAYLGEGNKAIALQRLNEVRMRAALSDEYTQSMKLDEINLDVILDERGRELLGEHDRWFDLKRTGKLIERVFDYNIFVQKYNNLNQNHLLRPIPQDEINKLNGLGQNEGY